MGLYDKAADVALKAARDMEGDEQADYLAANDKIARMVERYEAVMESLGNENQDLKKAMIGV